MEEQSFVVQREILGQKENRQQQVEDTQRSPYQKFSFTGNAGEYFGIWIVNILLTIITCGIYSAWAKVRRNRYFYGNTKFAGNGFDYHATGMRILLGRIIVFVGLVVFVLLSDVNPAINLILILIYAALVPLLIARGLRFNARVTSYRNVRFGFTGGYGGAFLAFIVGPFLSTISLSLLDPIRHRWLHQYIGNNLTYGGKPFSLPINVKPFYKIWFVSFLQTLAVVSVFFFIIFLASFLGISTSKQSIMGGSVAMLAILVTYFFIFAIVFIYRAKMRNLAWSATFFDGDHKTRSDLPPWDYMWVFISNILVTAVTFGFMRPWAAVRMARYKCEHFAISVQGEIEEIVGAMDNEGSAVGAEFMDFDGIDLGF